MAASITGQELGPMPGQAKIDLLFVGDVTSQYLADILQKFLCSLAEVTVTVSDMKKAAALLDEHVFTMVFLKVTWPAFQELDAVRLIRFGKKKYTRLLFVFIIPENSGGHAADITLTEPLTVEKLDMVVKYWKACFSDTVTTENPAKPQPAGWPLPMPSGEHLGYFSTDRFACSDAQGSDAGLELNAPLSDAERDRKIPLHHSSKEKLRRERMKSCCEQLRTLLPYVKGRKNDAASVFEATADYVQRVRERLPPAVMDQITEALQSDGRFCKKQPLPVQLSLPDTIMAQREHSVLASTYSPVRGIRFLANQCLNVYSLRASGGPLDDAVRGPSGSPSENAVGDACRTRGPSTALSLNHFHAVRCYSKVLPSYDTAAVTSANVTVHFPSAVPTVPPFLAPHCTSVLAQACPAPHSCLHQFWTY